MTMQENELVFKSGRALGSMIRTKEISPVEVVEAYLDRIEQLNPKVNSFITILRDESMAKARRAESEIQAGRYIGPLHGLPTHRKISWPQRDTGPRTVRTSRRITSRITNRRSRTS